MQESIFLPDAEPARKKQPTGTKVLVGVMVGVGCIFVVGWVALIAAWVYGYRGDLGGGILDAEPAVMPAVSVETLPQRQADLQAAFASAEPGADPQTLSELRSFLDALVASAQEWDLPAFRAQVDVDRFLMEAKKTGLIRGLTRDDEEDYATNFRESWLYPPGAWERYVIVRVKPLPDEHSAVIVYAYFWDKSQYAVETRLWLARSPADWKLFDWEAVPFGPRRSFEAAAHIRYSTDPRLQYFYQTTTDIAAADQKRADGDSAAAVELLKKAESRPRLPELADGQLVDLAFAWWRQGRNDDCLRCARQVGRPQAAPGGLYLQAVIFQQLRSFRRALDFARQFEQAAGGGPQIWELLAQLHENLDEPEKAAEYWKKLLVRDPENGDALQSLAELLDERDVASFADLLEKSDRSVESATSIAERLAYSRAPFVLRAVSEFVTRREPDSARAAYVAGLAAQNAGNDEEAAAHFKVAFERESDEEFRKTCVMRFLDAMSASDKLGAGYDQAPDPGEAFEYLLSGGEDGDSSLTLAKRKVLIEAHRQKFPDDPNVYFQAALVFQEEQDFDAAQGELTRAIEHAADDDARNQYRRALVNVLHEAGRDTEAYRTLPPAEETFRQLVQLSRWNSDSTDSERLTELHRLHQAASPQDGWLDLCATLIQVREKKSADALKTAQRGFDKAGDEMLKSQFQQMVVELALDIPDFPAAAKVFASPEEALNSLGQRCMNASDWEKLDALLAWYQTVHPQPSSEFRYFKIVAAWNRQDYGAVAALFDSSTQFPGDERHLWQRQKLNEWHVRSLMKSDGNLDRARSKALAIYNDTGQAVPLLLVHLAQRNATEVDRLLTDNNLSWYELDALYHDPEAGAVMSSAEFLPVRRKFPPTLSYLVNGAEAVLLLREPVVVAPESLKQVAAAIFGDDVTIQAREPVPGPRPRGILSEWLIQSGSALLAVTFGTGRYDSPTEHSLPKNEKSPLGNVVEGHHGWIDIEEIGLNRNSQGNSGSGIHCYRFATNFLTENVVALYLPRASRLVEHSSEVREAMITEDPLVSLRKLGVARWLAHGTDENDELQKRRRDFQKAVGTFADRVRAGQSGERFQVAVVVRSGSAAEVLTVNVNAAKRDRFRGTQLTGTLDGPSQMIPRLVGGEPVRVYPHAVISWSISGGNRLERASLWE